MNETEKMQAIQTMQATDGWKLLSEYINGQIEYRKGQLMTCENTPTTICEHRTMANAFSAVLKFCDDTIIAGTTV